MKFNHVHFLGCCLLVVLVIGGSSNADPEVKATQNADLDVKNPVILDGKKDLNKKTGGLDPINVDSVEDGKDQLNKLKESVNSDSTPSDKLGSNDNHNIEKEKGDSKEKLPIKNAVKSNPSENSGSNESHDVQTEKSNLKVDLPVKDSEKKDKPSEGLKPREKPKDGNKEEMPLKKKNSLPVEDCDTSNMCKDEVNNFVACLRVPGNESPELSLLIQYKGISPLTVRISAPDYVHLETTKVRLVPKEDMKVKVSIKQGGTDNQIILTAGTGRCVLDFKNMLTHNSEKNSENALNSKYPTHLNQTPFIAIILVTVFLISGLIWTCFLLKQKYFPGSSNFKYQKLDLELPIASGCSKQDSDENDGWDNSWDDNWGDEEAPKTPLLPVTPSLSSKGLVERRGIKDAWKD